MDQDMKTLQIAISHRFSQVKYLRCALTHSSYANECEQAVEDNERLEYLGDAVLELAVSEMLYLRFPEAAEGELTRMRAGLVSEPALASAARDLRINELILLGKGEETQGGRNRDSILSDALEAVFGAVFLDGGYEAAKKSVAAVLAPRIPALPEAPREKDPKSRLQELTQKLFKSRPVYTLARSLGPEHAKIFEVMLTLPDGRTVSARGPNMKKAEQKAAAKALKLFTVRGA